MTSRPLFEPIFLTDAEIAKRLGMSPAEWAPVAAILERSGLPRRDALFGNRRCWPTVQDFLLRRSSAGIHHAPKQTAESLENLHALGTTRGRRAGAR